jgi:hypothetical protein
MTYHSRYSNNCVSLDTTLYHRLAMGHDIADLAHTTFYRTNTFIFFSTMVGRETRIRLPPIPTRPLTRKLQIRLYLCDHDWAIMQRLAEGESGIDNVRHVEVYFLCRGPRRNRIRCWLPQNGETGA